MLDVVLDEPAHDDVFAEKDGIRFVADENVRRFIERGEGLRVDYVSGFLRKGFQVRLLRGAGGCGGSCC